MSKPATVLEGLTSYFSVAMLTKLYLSGNALTAGEYLTALLVNNTDPNGNLYYNMVDSQAPQLRLLLGTYTRNVSGNAGESAYWAYDPTPTGVDAAGWTLVAGGAAGLQITPNNNYGIQNVSTDPAHPLKSLLLGADWDGYRTQPSPAPISNITVLQQQANPETLTAVANVPYTDFFPEPASPFEGHIQDIKAAIDQDAALRFFGLAIVLNPSFTQYLSSKLFEFTVEGSPASPTVRLVGDVVDLPFNAVSIKPVVYDGALQLFVPCIGGPQSLTDVGNGVASRLVVIDASYGLSQDNLLNVYNGAAPSTSLNAQDIRGIAIAENGKVHVLTGNYANGGNDFNGRLYVSSVPDLLAKAPNDNPIDLTVSDVGTRYNSYFNNVAVVRPDGSADEYFLYVRGGRTTPPGSTDFAYQDSVDWWHTEGPYSDHSTIGYSALSNQASDYMVNNMAVYHAPTGTYRKVHSTAPASHPAVAAAATAAAAPPEEEK